MTDVKPTKFNILCGYTLKVYDMAMEIERELDKKKLDKGDINQWSNIMRNVLGLMLYTDIDDVFLEQPEKMKEYDQMLLKYLNMQPPSHEMLYTIPKLDWEKDKKF